MDTSFPTLFTVSKPVIACIHLLPLPGAPAYGGRMHVVIERALHEAGLFEEAGVHGLIIENFNDVPFYPDKVPPETVAAMTAVTRDIIQAVTIPVGVNVLRNDGHAALAVAVATGAHFIRVNVHMGAMVTDQGLIQGQAHLTARLRRNLGAPVRILADVMVKHAAPLAQRPLELEVLDLVERGMADAIIVTGDRTGGETSEEMMQHVKTVSDLPVLVGSGVTPEQLPGLAQYADGFIIGSFFKTGGHATEPVDPERTRHLLHVWKKTTGSVQV